MSDTLNELALSPAGHPQAWATIHGKPVAVDAGVLELINLLNDTRGIETYNSCQGDVHEAGYAQFGGRCALALLPFFATHIFLSQERRLPSSEAPDHYNEEWHEKLGKDGISIEVRPRGGLVLYWKVGEYDEILHIVRDAMRHQVVAPRRMLNIKMHGGHARRFGVRV